MLNDQTVKRLVSLAEQNRERVFAVADFIWKNPETGYREWKTSAFLEAQFNELGYKPVAMKDIPGFYADLDTGRPGPTLAVLAEMDSVICAGHPDADPETAAVHACGHHTQCAYLVGSAATLSDPEVLGMLSGKIRFVAVPAEELIELGYRASLREKGIIGYFGGKVEFLRRGVFDNVDAAIMIHSGSGKEKSVSVYKGNNGCLAKNITYIGKAAHAGGGPHLAVNALYAASLGLQAVNSIRETFVEANFTRVHPIITAGGAAVNVIPETVKLESYVRGATPEAIVAENKKVNRALAGAALSLGARVRVSDMPGYMPLHNNPQLNDISREIGEAILGKEKVGCDDHWGTGSTDMGDLSCVIPAIQPSGGGGKGTGHGEDFCVADLEAACVDSTKYVAGLAAALLTDGGERLRKLKADFVPTFESKAAYFEFVDALTKDRELVTYDGETAGVIW